MASIDTAPVPRRVATVSVDRDRDRQTKVFLIVLCLATALPWISMPLFGHAPGLGPQTARRLAYAVALPHTMSTFALYFDRGIRPLFAQHRRRFLYAPIALVIALPTFFWLAPHRATSLFLVVAGGWAVFHVSKQNLGVMAFTCSARNRPGPTDREREVLTLIGAAATLGIMAYSDILADTGLEAIEPLMRSLSIALTAAAVLAAAPLVWRRRDDLVCCLILAQAALFFTPVFFLSDLGSLPYGAAHALQYLVFMAFLVKYQNPAEPKSMRGFVVAATITTVVGAVLLRTLYRATYQPAIGLAFAFVVMHFLMDSSIWRLRRPVQREYVGRRFAFIDG